jgi:TM2 domain-containing membrane protein YozV
MFCPKCGKEIPSDASFCPNCGSPIANSAPTIDQSGAAPEPKSALAAGLFGIFLGGFGAHNFYLGYTGRAIVQLILTLLIVFAPISYVWGVIEGILILAGQISVDGRGNPLKRDV